MKGKNTPLHTNNKEQLTKRIRGLEARVKELESMINKLKRIEEQFSHYQGNVHQIFDKAGVCFILADLEGTILKINPTALKKLGYTEDEIVGQSLSKIYPLGDKSTVAELFKREVGRERVLPRLACITKDGKRISVETTVTNARWKDKEVFLITGQDVTELERLRDQAVRSERRYRAIFENAPIGIASVDKKGTLLFANRALQDMLGYDDQELKNMHFAEFTYPDDRRASLDALFSLQEGRVEHVQLEKRYIKKDGSQMWARTHVSSVRDKDGQIAYFIAMVEDITKEKIAEVEIRRSQSQLRHLAARMERVTEEERKRLSRELHDSVGQSLSAININLNVINSKLCDRCKNNLKTRLFDTIGLVEEVTGCVRDVMHDLRPDVLDDYGLLAALRWYAERLSKRFGIAIDVTGKQQDERLDPDKEITLFRICQEALINVLKHAEADKVWIDLDDDDETVRVAIVDNGKGFVLKKRGGMSRGLGLITMKERAYSIGGRVRIESRPGQGTKVTIEVKRHRGKNSSGAHKRRRDDNNGIHS